MIKVCNKNKSEDKSLIVWVAVDVWDFSLLILSVGGG